MILASVTTYGDWTPPQLSFHGGDLDNLINIIHVFMAFLFVPWLLFYLFCLNHYRQRPGHGAKYEPIKAKISKYAEIGVIIFEAILLVGFSTPAWAKYKNEPPAAKDRLEIHVIAQQFQWNFHYAGKDGIFGRTDASKITASNPIGLDDTDPNAKDDIVTINDFHIPTNKDIYVRITSKDVIHSFDIPTMRVKQDAIPGMEIPIWFKVDPKATSASLIEQMSMTVPIEEADWYRIRHFVTAEDYSGKGDGFPKKGDSVGDTREKGEKLLERMKKAGVTQLKLQPEHALEVVCSQLCGNSHFKMKASMTTHDEAGFEQWMKDQFKKPEGAQEF